MLSFSYKKRSIIYKLVAKIRLFTYSENSPQRKLIVLTFIDFTGKKCIDGISKEIPLYLKKRSAPHRFTDMGHFDQSIWGTSIVIS